MHRFQNALVALLVIAICGCASHRGPRADKSTGSTPRLPDAAKYSIDVVVETGGEAAKASKAIQLDQVRAYMEKDLVNILTKRGGYTAQAIPARDKFTPGPNRRMVVARIVKYNPGSKAARIAVGFGAGAASLDIEYEFYSDPAQASLSKTDGVGSGRDWNFCVRKLDENILAELNSHMVGKGGK